MANKQLFANDHLAPTAVNAAGGAAYAMTDEHALAQLAAVGTFHDGFYATAAKQLADFRSRCAKASPTWLAKLAVCSRRRFRMKDMPVALLLELVQRDPALARRIFPAVVDNGKQLRTLASMLRSGAFGRKSFNGCLRALSRKWFAVRSEDQLLHAMVGADPSMRDLLRMIRPKPADDARASLYAWMAGKPKEGAPLPPLVDLYERFKAADDEGQAELLAKLPFRTDMLAGLLKGGAGWKALGRKMAPMALRMNLNSLARHGAFDDQEFVQEVAAKLAAPEAAQAGQQPHQWFAAYKALDPKVPAAVKQALSHAADRDAGTEAAIGKTLLLAVDVSGSMSQPVHGDNRGKTSCNDAAAVMAAAFLRRNPDSVVVTFDTTAKTMAVDAGDTLLSLASRFSFAGGGTSCSAPFRHALAALGDRQFDGAVLLSDEESWVDAASKRGTGTMNAWRKFAQAHHARQPRLACVDLAANSANVADSRDRSILNVGGFGEATLGLVARFLARDESTVSRSGPAPDLFVELVDGTGIPDDEAADDDS